MVKLSQTELLQEGFLDAVRAAGRGVANAAAYAKRIDTEGFGVLKSPINRFLNSDPKQFVSQELKTSYYKTFNTKSIKIIEVKKDTTPQQNVQYLPRVNTRTNRFIVSFSAERFIPSGGTSPSEIYYAHVLKGGEKNELSMDVRDEDGNQIQGEKSKKAEKPTFTNIIKNYQTKGTPITVAILSTIITKNLGISEREFAKKLLPGATDMDEVILGVTNKNNVTDILNQADIDSVANVLRTRSLVEKVNISQKVLLEQLKNL
jgi:hypothetical protein